MTKLIVTPKRAISECEICGESLADCRAVVSDEYKIFYICNPCIGKLMTIFSDDIQILEEEEEAEKT